jgi:hypothetical protein
VSVARAIFYDGPSAISLHPHAGDEEAPGIAAGVLKLIDRWRVRAGIEWQAPLASWPNLEIAHHADDPDTGR